MAASNFILGSTTAQIAALTTKQIAALSTDDYAAITTAQIQALTTANLVLLSTDQLQALSTSAVSALRTSQAVVLTTDEVVALTSGQLSAFTTSAIQVFSTQQVQAIEARDLVGLTSAQLNSLNTAGVVALTTDQIVALTTAQVAGLNTRQIRAIETSDLAALTTDQIQSLETANVRALLTNQAAALTTDQLIAFTTSQIQALGTAAIVALTTAQFSAIETQDIAALTTLQVVAIETRDIAALTTDQVQAFTSAQYSAFTPAQKAVLPFSIGLLTTAQIAALTTAQIAGLSTAQVVALSTAQAAAISTAGIEALTTSQVQALETIDIAALTTRQISVLTSGQTAVFSTNQVEALSSAQISALSTAAYQQLDVSGTPIIFDLNGDGVHTLSLANGVRFDLFADGSAVNTGWVDAHDGLLVLDRNHDGMINNGSELFGSATPLADGAKAGNGYVALREFDLNGDGYVDREDAAYSDLKLWVDKNSDGISDAAEIFSLESLGIARISVNATKGAEVDNGNLLGLLSHYVSTDGTQHSAADVWFRTEGQFATSAVQSGRWNNTSSADAEPPAILLDFGGAGGANAPPNFSPVTYVHNSTTASPLPTGLGDSLRFAVSGLAQAVSAFTDSTAAPSALSSQILGSGNAELGGAPVALTVMGMAGVMKQFDVNGNLIGGPVQMTAADVPSLQMPELRNPSDTVLFAFDRKA